MPTSESSFANTSYDEKTCDSPNGNEQGLNRVSITHSFLPKLHMQSLDILVVINFRIFFVIWRCYLLFHCAPNPNMQCVSCLHFERMASMRTIFFRSLSLSLHSEMPLQFLMSKCKKSISSLCKSQFSYNLNDYLIHACCLIFSCWQSCLQF